MALTYVERLAVAEPLGLLVLHHGRGADEHDLLPLADALDPGRVLHVVSARGPLQLPGWGGYHWYEVPRVGYPDSKSFDAVYRELADLHEQLWLRTGLSASRTVLGGFSMGAVMSYALGLGPDRPPPAGVLAFSGFVPTVEGWLADLEGRQATRALIAHGTRDPVIDVSFARAAHQLLEGGGLQVGYHESDVGHRIDAAVLPAAIEWLASALG
jgi:phospholipase/carboxylesterase